MGDTKGFSEKVLAVLLQYRNQTVTLAQICTATGFSETLVQRTVNNLKAKKEMHYSITVVIRGRAWVLRDAPPAVDPGKRIFEEIGAARDGSVVIQDSAGKLYRAVEL